MSDNIKVVVKVRPLISRELDDKLSYQWRVKNNTLYQVDQSGKDCGPCFTFDKVYDKDTKTRDIYNDIAKPIVEAATAGFNGTIFAYGQTSSGKTYTMTGTEVSPGIIPLAVRNLFQIIKNIPDRDFLVRVSYIEIYNETLKDLLSEEKKSVKVQETLQGLKMDCKEQVTTSPEEVLKYLKEGDANRQTGATNMNEESSRSHSIFQITIESREHIEGEAEAGCVNVSQLNLVDLAGSERAGQTGATGLRFKEGTHINKSLSTLALVIKQLSEDQQKHVNYRDSKLTRILQNSLGGNAKTSIICAVTPAAVEETISTLQFANRAKAIKNKPEVNAVATDATMIQSLTKQLSKLQSQLETKKNLEVMLEDKKNVEHHLQTKIAALQRLILNGFGARSDLGLRAGPRRLLPPRRVTISTLHPAEESPVPAVPKFHTPSLKYNPMVIPGSSDFIPIPNTTELLPCVPEEDDIRLITPPPPDKKLDSDEIIDLDSDNDSSTVEVQTCSPYHKCYGSSKTPPCVLRKNAKLAEKNLKDIVELTEREKIYPPKEVELIEKLEQNTAVITRLEEEVNALNKISKEKDLEINQLIVKVTKSNEEIKSVNSAKADLEALCKEYTTKLTDWEVSYDTLKAKTKRREDELLSLLEEHKLHKKVEETSKLIVKNLEKDFNFMDMSKDISLVNSDNDSSLTKINDDEARSQRQELVENIQYQLTSENSNVPELEGDLIFQKQKILTLENCCHELQQNIDNFKEKVMVLETENSLLKTSIDTLNSTIQSQKSNLEIANNDIDSYNSVIQELNIKLYERDRLSKSEITDNLLEKMIANEERFIANNENMRNIIHCFKMALDTRNKEIESLKCVADQNLSTDMNLKEQLSHKEKEVADLNEKVTSLQSQIAENIVLINKLMQEKTNFTQIEHQLTNQLSDITSQVNQLEKDNKEKDIQMHSMKENNDRLTNAVNEKDAATHELSNVNNVMSIKISELDQIILSLREEIGVKDKLIISLNAHDTQTQEFLFNANSVLLLLHNIISKLTGNSQELPNSSNNLNDAFDSLKVKLNLLEVKLTEIISQKDLEIEKYVQLSSDVEKRNNMLTAEVTELKSNIEAVNKSEHEHNRLKHDLMEQINSLVKERDTIQLELEQKLHESSAEIENLKYKVLQSEENTYTLLNNILKQTSLVLSSLNLECIPESHNNVYDNIISALNSISNYAMESNSKSINEDQNTEEELLRGEETMKGLLNQNHDLLENVSEFDMTNKTLRSEIEKIRQENKVLNENFAKGSELLSSLKIELSRKSNDLENAVVKTQQLKDHFIGLDVIMKQEIKDLQSHNEILMARCSELETNLAVEEKCIKIQNIDNENSLIQQSLVDSIKIVENKCPPTLLTICCNKIIETIQPNEKSVSPSESNTSISLSNKEKSCDCDLLLPELRSAEIENMRLSQLVKSLEAQNCDLISEQEQVRHEVQLLLEPAFELQKKINSHKTNLSTLTATTYAENKSLKSQLKVLQHHHARFHNVCHRDLPVFRKQLIDLMTILNEDKTYFDTHNSSFKRYSLPSVLLENSSTINNIKNESTFDGDLLMLDTNLTLATSADNTLADHTCLDMTQACPSNEIGCQTHILTCEDTHHPDLTQLNILSNENRKLYEKIQILEQENQQLGLQAYGHTVMKESLKDAQNSPIKSCADLPTCEYCENLKHKQHSLENEIELLSQKLDDVEAQKKDIENKYKNLSLEIPSTDALVKKLTIFDKELQSKVQEINKLTTMLSHKSQELKQMQQEYDTLSTQVMENITEMDDLNKELENVKDANTKLTVKYHDLEKILLESKGDSKNGVCSQCQIKEEIINSLKNAELQSKLNRSFSDSETSSRLNKICTLQNELHAGREDCKELTEDVATIKNHLDRSNLSLAQNMDLDESIGESNIFNFTKHFDIPIPTQERHSDMYSVEKLDCINYFVEKTGADKENLDCNIKIIDIMKMFYNSFTMKHSNEVENLVNKIKCYEESRNQLETHVNKLSNEYSEVTKKLEEKEHSFQTVSNVLSQIRVNTTLIKQEVANFSDVEKNTKFIDVFKEKFLKLVDIEFGVSSVSIFENLIDSLVLKHQEDLSKIMNQYTELQEKLEGITAELSSVEENLLQMKSQLTEKENEYNLLKAQKERIHEINNALTLDLIQKEQDLSQTLMSGWKKLVENNIMCTSDIDMMPLNQNVTLLFDSFINEIRNRSTETEKEKEHLTLEIKKSKTEIEENQKAQEMLKAENEKLKEISRTVTLDFIAQNSLHTELNKKYLNVVEENNSYTLIVDKMSTEIETLKEALIEKETAALNMISDKNAKELLEKEEQIIRLAESYKEEINTLRSVNAVIAKEKDLSDLELQRSKELLRINTIELDRVTADIIVLRESVKESSSVIETLKTEAKSLLQQNVQLKEQFDLKCKDCSRLEMNIKTHEKTAEIQSKMIMRLQKQKEEDEKSVTEKDTQLEELTLQISELQRKNDIMTNIIKANREEVDDLKKAKEALEGRPRELERAGGPAPRPADAGGAARRRRQSIHDSKRMFSENQDGDHNKVEAVFDSLPQPVDLFMEVDDDSSNRSTPLRNSRGRDSLQSRHDQSEEPPSRPSSVAETRRRRQSIHDLRRSVPQTPSPHERLSTRLGELTKGKSPDIENNNVQSEVKQLRSQLSTCQQELEELKERYRELDDECETCAQYLRERDAQCARLKKEKAALEVLLTDLKDKLQSVNPNRSQQEQKTIMCHAAVNTDEDWANLHSVVVDRMSYDAEVEKNKRLAKTIEELRFKKQELKVTLGKMQKALERSATRDHSKALEMTKLELRSCKQELLELKEKYRELDEECETCSQYLREREEQCRRLKEAKAALEAKLEECREGRGSPRARALRRRRGEHDRRRAPGAATDIGEDFLSYQVERDDNSKKSNEDKDMELKQLKLTIEKLSQQPPAAPLVVATGSAIVQNQQLSDVMKENQKLKKMNTKLIQICKKRGKKADFTNEDLSEHTLG